MILSGKLSRRSVEDWADLLYAITGLIQVEDIASMTHSVAALGARITQSALACSRL
jgi:hypothetical protein